MNHTRLDAPQRILKTARILFSRNGFDGTSIRDVTGQAGVNLGAVTYHFGSKQALYDAVICSFIDPMQERFDEVVTGEGPPLDRIDQAVRTLFEHFDQNPDIPSLIMNEISRGGPLPVPVRNWVAHALESLATLVAEGQAEGTVVAGHPMLTAASCIGQPFFFAITRRPRERTPGLETILPDTQETADHVSAFIRRSLSAPGRTR